MPRKEVRAGFVTVRCPCGKRLALLQPTRWSNGRLATDGHWLKGADHGTFHAGSEVPARKVDFQPMRRPTSGVKHLGHEDWTHVICPKCEADWSGRESYLHALITGARDGQVTLGDTPRARR